MSEDNSNKSKIGARSLSDEEAKLILPTYDQIYKQVEQFRQEKYHRSGGRQDENGEQKQDIDQKTNNIGIMGVRGAGKTSVLKTIKTRLEKTKRTHNDVVLPIIVPENMSESSTLMATVLGMLSDVVKEKEREHKKGKNEDCIRKSELTRKCEQVIKQYTYIQKDYRDILIHEYTTENDYVRRSADVFNSDTEFIQKFNQLIRLLVNDNDQKDGMLFVFIDDIDLSTRRCTDVVKTLLSYLSNENIVTFISGDLDTFEEALTLEFLRQEKALDKNVLDQKVGDDSILDSKKRLAYEYLKKILPPVYRYNIKYWSLEQRANYCVGEEKKKGEEKWEEKEKMGMRLSDLLKESLNDWIDPAFFCVQENGEAGPLPYTYALFDGTSRGLNNAYNILSEVKRRREKTKEGNGKAGDTEGEKGNGKPGDTQKEYLEMKKLLIDTLISSKAVYNEHRNDIQTRMILFSTNVKSSRIFFDNAYAMIYKEKEFSVGSDTEKKSGKNVSHTGKNHEKYVIEHASERFALFLLVDFAARLLYESNYGKVTGENEDYLRLKEKAMEDFFFHPEAAERALEVKRGGWGDTKKLRQIKYKDLSLRTLNICFLLKGDLALNLAYYRNLPLERTLKLYGTDDAEKTGGEHEDEELTQTVILAFWKALTSSAKISGAEVIDKATECASVFGIEFLYIREQLSASAAQNVVIRLFGELWEKRFEEREASKSLGEDWESLRKKQMLKRIMMNTITHFLGVKEDGSIEEVRMVLGETDVLTGDKISLEPEDVRRRVVILRGINDGNLWMEPVAEVAAGYLEKALNGYFEYIENNLIGHKKLELSSRPDWEKNISGWNDRCQEARKIDPDESWKLNIKAAEKSWRDFFVSNDGKTATKASKTKRAVRNVWEEYNFREKVTYDSYFLMTIPLEDLARNYRVWYGRTEAQKVMDALQQSYAEPEKDENWEKMRSCFAFFLYCYYKCREAAGMAEHLCENARLLAEIAGRLAEASSNSVSQELNGFIEKLNKQLEGEKIVQEKKIDMQEFEKLFS